MLNLLTKTKPWMVVSLLVATSVFGQNIAACSKPCPPKPCPPKPCAPPCPQPCPPTQMCEQDPCCPAWATPVLNAAYNYPARTQTRCPWDFFAWGSFIYWQPLQENMELGFIESYPRTADFLSGNGSFVNNDFDYKPGFKIGMGMNFDHDNWDSTLEYTWFHSSHSQSASVEDSTVERIFPLRGYPGVTFGSSYSDADQTWRLNMDFLDVDLGRTYYVGTKLVFRTAFGARGQWIRQKLSANYTLASDNAPVSVDVSQRANSWAVGPRATLKTNYIIGEGFRLFGNGGADILYTRYTKLNETTQARTNNVVTQGFRSRQKTLGALRTHLDLELGLGWGTYLDCNNWYMDFAAGYNFQTFFNQNMFRQYLASDANSFVPNGDLFVHGLNLTFRLDF